MATFPGVCSNCRKDITTKQNKNYKRIKLSTNLPRSAKTPADILKSKLNINVTPTSNNYMCSECAALLKNVDTSTTKTEEGIQAFLSMSKDGGYISKKRSLDLDQTSLTSTPKSRKTYHSVSSTPTPLRPTLTPVRSSPAFKAAFKIKRRSLNFSKNVNKQV